MKWIKASESLPEVFYGEFVVKKNGRKLITTFDQKTGFGISGNIEWLDESPAPAKTAEEIEKMADDLFPGGLYSNYERHLFINGFTVGYTAALQSQPCQTGYSRATVENALQRGVNIAMENLEWDGENHPTFDNITMVNKCNEYLSSLTNKPTE